MPLTPEHKRQTRARIVECARQLFNRYGFAEVSIDQIMAGAGLTRGGFYNHFKTKDELYVAVLTDYALSREAEAAQRSGNDAILAQRVFNHYASRTHAEDLDGQCPVMALPSDVARATPPVRRAYQRVFESLALLFETNASSSSTLSVREQALAVATSCVGTAVLAKTLNDADLVDELCAASRAFAADTLNW